MRCLYFKGTDLSPELKHTLIGVLVVTGGMCSEVGGDGRTTEFQ